MVAGGEFRVKRQGDDCKREKESKRDGCRAMVCAKNIKENKFVLWLGDTELGYRGLGQLNQF